MPVSLIRTILRRPRRRPLLAVTLMAIILALAVSTVWGFRIIGRAESLADRLEESRRDVSAAIGSGDSESFAELIAILDVELSNARDLDADLWPLRAVSRVLGWVPITGDVVGAAPNTTERLVLDLETSKALAGTANNLFRMYERLPEDQISLVELLDALPDAEDTVETRLLIATAERSLAKAENRADSVKGATLLWKFGSNDRRLRALEQELRLFVDWAGLTVDSIDAMATLGTAALPVASLFDVDAGDLQLSGDTLSAMPVLATAAGLAADALASANASAPEIIASSRLGRDFVDFEYLVAGLGDSARAGALLIEAIRPAKEVIENSPGGYFGNGSSLLRSIEALASGSDELAQAQRLLDAAGTKLSGRMFARLPVAMAATRLLDTNREIGNAIALLRRLPAIAPEALGANGPRRYLVLGQTSDELRGSGGFVSSLWIVSFDDGQIVQSAYHDIVAFDDLKALERYPSPPPLLADHMDAQVWLMRDVTWEPEFPQVARLADEIWAISGDGLPVDGVIAMTQWTLVRIVEALGQVELNNGVITADSVMETLESGTDAYGRAFTDELFRALLAELSGPRSLDRSLQLAQTMAGLLSEKHMLVHMFNDDLQKEVVRAGWDGSVAAGAADRIALVDSNVGWNKVDRNIDRSLELEVDLDGSNSTVAVNLIYHNRSAADAPGCERQENRPGRSYAQLKDGCYWNIFRVYIPDGAHILRADRIDLPENSIFHQLGLGVPGEDTLNIDVDSGGIFVSGLLAVPPGERRTVSFDIAIPGLVGAGRDQVLAYELDLVAQAGALGRDVAVTIRLPEGLEYEGGSLRPTDVNGGIVKYELTLLEDTSLIVKMRPTKVEAPLNLSAELPISNNFVPQ